MRETIRSRAFAARLQFSDDRELVAAETGDGVLGAHRALQALGHDLEDLVTGVVAERVVDGLEAVEVDHHDEDVAAAAHPACEGVGQPVVEHRAVQAPGERVVRGGMAEL